MNEHPDRLTILAFIEDDELPNRSDVASHLAVCDPCRGVLHELEELAQALSDGLVLRYLDTPDANREALRARILAEVEQENRDVGSAEALFSELLRLPVESWSAFLAEHPHVVSAALVRRIIAEVTLELDRRPERALKLLDVAEQSAYGLEDTESRWLLGDVWKQRSNALRMAGRYEEAVDAAEIAEAFYVSLTTGHFDLGQAQYTRGLALFKMMRFDAALEALEQSRATLEPFGDSAPLTKTLTLEAGIRFDRGDVEGAAKIWRDLVPALRRTADRLEIARVHANLAACSQRLGHLDEALENARIAMESYRLLGNHAEEARAAWTIALVKIVRNEDGGLDELVDVASEFEALGMPSDAGFVQLDVVEELLRRGEWTEAEITARQLVQLFTRAGVTLAKVSALDYLRQAVEKREATAATVQHVREFVAGDAAYLFIPNDNNMN